MPGRQALQVLHQNAEWMRFVEHIRAVPLDQVLVASFERRPACQDQNRRAAMVGSLAQPGEEIEPGFAVLQRQVEDNGRQGLLFGGGNGSADGRGLGRRETIPPEHATEGAPDRWVIVDDQDDRELLVRQVYHLPINAVSHAGHTKFGPAVGGKNSSSAFASSQRTLRVLPRDRTPATGSFHDSRAVNDGPP